MRHRSHLQIINYTCTENRHEAFVLKKAGKQNAMDHEAAFFHNLSILINNAISGGLFFRDMCLSVLALCCMVASLTLTQCMLGVTSASGRRERRKEGKKEKHLLS